MSERCETCRYWGKKWDAMERTSWAPMCQRFPKWERVEGDHWCGEWRAREAHPSWLEREP